MQPQSGTLVTVFVFITPANRVLLRRTTTKKRSPDANQGVVGTKIQRELLPVIG